MSPIKRSVARCHEVMNVWRYEEWAGNLRMSRATGTVPERVQSRVHTTEPTGPVPEPFHCDHIARWSARSGTTGRSGTGVNTGARLRSGTVPVPNVWCEHGLIIHSQGLDGGRMGGLDKVCYAARSNEGIEPTNSCLYVLRLCPQFANNIGKLRRPYYGLLGRALTTLGHSRDHAQCGPKGMLSDY